MTSAAATRPPRRTGRSILALLAGFVTVVILSLAADAILRAAGIFPATDKPPMSDGTWRAWRQTGWATRWCPAPFLAGNGDQTESGGL